MALIHYSKVFAIKEARIARMLTDPAGAPPATYGATFPLPGSKKLTIAGIINTKFLRGDNVLLDSDAVWDSLSGVIDYAKLSLDAMAVFFSSAVVDSGITPNQLATMAMKNTDNLMYWQLQCRSMSADPIAGDILITMHKCKLSGFPTMGLMEEDYQLSNVGFTLLPRQADNLWLTPVIRETAAVLA